MEVMVVITSQPLVTTTTTTTVITTAIVPLAVTPSTVALVTIPLLLFDAPASLRIAQGLMLALVALVGFLAARQADVSTLRALVYVAAVVASALLVLILKAAVGH